jgi:hypothetical protein
MPTPPTLPSARLTSDQINRERALAKLKDAEDKLAPIAAGVLLLIARTFRDRMRLAIGATFSEGDAAVSGMVRRIENEHHLRGFLNTNELREAWSVACGVGWSHVEMGALRRTGGLP